MLSLEILLDKLDPSRWNREVGGGWMDGVVCSQGVQALQIKSLQNTYTHAEEKERGIVAGCVCVCV